MAMETQIILFAIHLTWLIWFVSLAFRYLPNYTSISTLIGNIKVVLQLCVILWLLLDNLQSIDRKG